MSIVKLRIPILIALLLGLACVLYFSLHLKSNGPSANRLLQDCEAITNSGALGAIDSLHLFSPANSVIFFGSYDREVGEADSKYALNFGDPDYESFVLVTDERFDQCSVTVTIDYYLAIHSLSPDNFRSMMNQAILAAEGNPPNGVTKTSEHIEIKWNGTLLLLSDISDDQKLPTHITFTRRP